MKNKRIKLTVDRLEFRDWRVKDSNAGIFSGFVTQAEAIAWAVARAHVLRNADKFARVQVVIRGRDGRIKSERTYGDDPVRRKG